MSRTVLFLLMSVFCVASFPALAVDGMAAPWQMYFQQAASPVMEKLVHLHDYLMVVITSICVFVLALIIYICLRFNRRANPVPSKTSHNTLIEIIWTTIPVLILVSIFIPSIKILYFMDRAEKADMTLKVTGHQWYWSYEYPEHPGLAFDSNMVETKDLKPGQVRLLEVDNRIVVPVNTTVRVLTAGADVIHNFALPAFGLKIDAVPGRLNETWFKATREGVFRGQCSELCGVRHGFMPIVIEVVSKKAFDAWVASKTQSASTQGRVVFAGRARSAG